MTNINARIQTLAQYKGTKLERDIRQAFQTFILDTGREPTVIDIDSDPRFPLSARQIQRRFGGIKNLRRELGLNEQLDLSGHRKQINERGLAVEAEMYKLLLQAYDQKLVHRQYMYCDDERTKANFCLWDRIPNHRDIIDIFYPKDQHSLVGCINNKQQKHNTLEQHFIKGTWTAWFVCANPAFSQAQLDDIVNAKSKPLLPYQKVISYTSFKEIFVDTMI